MYYSDIQDNFKQIYPTKIRANKEHKNKYPEK